jgi:hypothetical protein
VSYKDVVLGDNPSVYYRLGDSSAPAVPTNSLGVNAAATGSPTFGQAGALGGDPDTAVSFPGSAGTDYLQTAGTPGSAYDLGDGPFSIEFWYKTNSTAADRNPLSKGTASYIMRHLAGGTWAFRLSGTGNCFVTTAAFTDTSKWHHVVVTRVAATQPILYVDGVAQAGTYTARTFTNNTTGFGIGVDVAAKPTGAWNGLVDEVALYKSVLSQSQVTAHYQAGLGLFGPLQPPAPRRRFPFQWRKRSGAAQPLPAAAPAVTTQPLPPQPGRSQREPWTTRRRGRPVQPPTGPAFNGSYPAPPQPRTARAIPRMPRRSRAAAQPLPTQITVTVAPWVPTSESPRPRWWPKRATGSFDPPLPPVAPPIPQSRTALLAPWFVGRRRRGQTQVVVTAAAVVPQPATSLVVPRFVRARSRQAQPVPAQVVVATSGPLVPQARTALVVPWPVRARARQAQPVPAQQVVVAVPPQPPSRRMRPPIVMRGQSATPLPVQVTVVTQPLPPQPGRPVRAAWLPRRRPRATQTPLVVTVSLPAQPPRRRPAWLPPRRARVTPLVPRVVVLVPAQVVTRRRLAWPPVRRRGQMQPVPLQIAVTVPAWVPQPVRPHRGPWWFGHRASRQAGPVPTPSVAPAGVTVVAASPAVTLWAAGPAVGVTVSAGPAAAPFGSGPALSPYAPGLAVTSWSPGPSVSTIE